MWSFVEGEAGCGYDIQIDDGSEGGVGFAEVAVIKIAAL